MSENITNNDIEEVDISLSVLETIKFVTEEEESDTEFRELCNEVILSYAKEQCLKQKIYGVAVKDSGHKTKVWRVFYNTFRDIDKIEGYNFLTKEDKDRFVEENFALIYSVADKFKPSENQTTYTYEDILEACFEGLTIGLNNYNPYEVKVKRVTYLYKAMSNKCIDYIRNSGIKGKKDNTPLSLDYEYSDKEDDSFTLKDTIENDESAIDKKIEDNVYKETCERILEGLDDLSKYITINYFGILGYEKKTQLELSLELNISKKNISNTLLGIEEHFKKKVYELGINPSDLFD